MDFFQIKEEFQKSREEFMREVSDALKTNEEVPKSKSTQSTPNKNIRTIGPCLQSSPPPQHNEQKDTYTGPNIQPESATEPCKKKKVSSRMRALFNKIAMRTHPDKFPDDPESAAIFEIAKKALDKQKFAKLVFLCKTLSLEIGQLTKDETREVEAFLKHKLRKIETYKQTIPMLWKQTTSPDVRSRLVRAFIEQNGYAKAKD